MKISCTVLTMLVIFLGMWAAAPVSAEGSPKQLYRLYCVQCHGTQADGKGLNWSVGGLAVFPMDHTSAAMMSKIDDVQIKEAITRGGDAVGKSELMPGWGEVLSEDQINGLVKYLRTLCKCKHKK